MNFTLAINIAALIAPIIAVVGLLYAARQALMAIGQLAHAKDSQAISVHCSFQKEFRDWQARLPPEANSESWLPKNQNEHRLMQLYWEFVFDEWYSCKIISSEPKIVSLWDGYAKGVEGAFCRSAFTQSLRIIFEEKTYFLGRSMEFRAELVRIYESSDRAKTHPSIPF
jgi:hypothetical protein